MAARRWQIADGTPVHGPSPMVHSLMWQCGGRSTLVSAPHELFNGQLTMDHGPLTRDLPLMKIIAAALAGLVLFAVPARADEVQLIQNEHTLKIVIGDEVFAVYHLGEGYKKPFLYPVAVAG